jgi:tRNA(adenine34) deaminase
VSPDRERPTIDRFERWMREALIEARRAGESGEVPVGAVVVAGDDIVGRGGNQPIGAQDPTAHAEIVAIRDAARRAGNYRLVGCTLVVSVEPCLMCIGALVHARIGLLVYGAPEPKAGAVLSVARALSHPGLNHRFPIVAGVLEDDCRGLLQDFFRSRRESSGSGATASETAASQAPELAGPGRQPTDAL